LPDFAGCEKRITFKLFANEDSTRGEVVPGLVEKAFGSARAGTKKNAIELCLAYVEVENSGEGVVVSLSLSRGVGCVLEY
jgi:cytoskeleton-associated protein 5